jgi:periplasmic copper chaperone A
MAGTLTGTRFAGLLGALMVLASAALSAGCGSAGAAAGSVPKLQIADARAPAPASPDVAVVYLTVTNRGSASDRLVSASTDAAKQASVHQEIRKGLLITMAPSGPQTIPAHKSLVLSVGGSHLMLEGLLRPLNVGDHFAVTFHFQRSGDLTVSVPVVADSST